MPVLDLAEELLDQLPVPLGQAIRGAAFAHAHTGVGLAAAAGLRGNVGLEVPRPARPDVADILGLLLTFRAASKSAVDILLEARADPRLRTRIDDCETPREMAEGMGLRQIADRLAAREGRLRLPRRHRPEDRLEALRFSGRPASGIDRHDANWSESRTTGGGSV